MKPRFRKLNSNGDYDRYLVIGKSSSKILSYTKKYGRSLDLFFKESIELVQHD
jgi:3'-phosphoadenosine 5'-phosphosulfate sulfotransferase